MIDPETSRAFRRLMKEIREDVPVVVRGLAISGKRLARKIYSETIRRSKSLLRSAKGWEVHFGRKTLVSRLSRVRLRSPIYKV